MDKSHVKWGCLDKENWATLIQKSDRFQPILGTEKPIFASAFLFLPFKNMGDKNLLDEEFFNN